MPWSQPVQSQLLRPSSEVGNFIGSCIYVERVPPTSAKIWDYGVVTSYTWNETLTQGKLHVAFMDKTEDVIFDETIMQDFAIETYAILPCYHQPVCKHYAC